MELNKLIEESKTFLSSYEYEHGRNYETFSVKTIIEEWFKNKKDLLNLFEKHSNYNGRGQIILNDSYCREINKSTVVEKLKELPLWRRRRPRQGYEEAYRISDEFEKLISLLEENNELISNFVEEDLVKAIENYKIDLKATKGTKFSRFIRKICIDAKLDERENFERIYAQFSDAVNPLTIERYTVLSVNPMDYWGMSFGNSWSSCHSIDKTNKRGKGGDNYSGCYSSGTESYMLDSTSVVMYTVDKKSDISRPELCDKVTRQMIHIGEDAILQGRLYPQCNDGVSSEYKKMREIAQRVIAELRHLPNYWRNKKGYDACNEVVVSNGTHYEDYFNFDYCNVSYNILKENSVKKIYIGHYPICPECGKTHHRQDNIECSDCAAEGNYCYRCDTFINEDEEVYVDGRYYCCWECAENDGFVYTDDDGWHHRDECIYCDYYEEYFYYTSDAIYTHDGHVFLNSNAANDFGYVYVEDKNDWYEDGDVYWCETCQEYHLIDEPCEVNSEKEKENE